MMRDFSTEHDDLSHSAGAGAISFSGPYSASNYCRILRDAQARREGSTWDNSIKGSKSSPILELNE